MKTVENGKKVGVHTSGANQCCKDTTSVDTQNALCKAMVTHSKWQCDESAVGVLGGREQGHMKTISLV